MEKTAKKRKTVEYGKYGYLFILPFFLVYLVFQFAPLLYTIFMSFMENYKDGLKQIGPNFVGLENYKNTLWSRSGVLFDTYTMKALGNTIVIWVLNFIPQILISLLFAAWFTDTRVKLKAQGGFKVIMFLPNIITAASMGVLFYSLFNSSGVITVFLRSVHVVPESYDFMNSRIGTQGIIAFIQFLMWYGNTMVVLIAGILGINPSLFEAARVDGASSGQIFRSITLPLLKPITLFTLVTSAVGGLQMYDIPAVFNTNQSGDGLPDFASNTLTMYIRKLTVTSADYGKASAASIVLFFVTLIISAFFFVFLGDREKKPKKITQ